MRSTGGGEDGLGGGISCEFDYIFLSGINAGGGMAFGGRGRRGGGGRRRENHHRRFHLIHNRDCVSTRRRV
jgi:hypothetical protein